MNTPPHDGDDVLAALRRCTASRHQQAEALMPLAQSAVTLDHFHAHLWMLWAWLHPLEQWLRRFTDGPQNPAQLPPHAHTPLIAADLNFSHLPLEACPYPLQTWDACLTSSPGHRWGIMYVVEGSQLGGAVLYKRLRERLAPHPLGYLAGDAHTPAGARWRQFVAALRAAVREPADIDAACAGAVAAFDQLLALARQETPAMTPTPASVPPRPVQRP